VWDIDAVERRGQYTISMASSPEPMREGMGDFQVDEDETTVVETSGPNKVEYKISFVLSSSVKSQI
jgi:hypothetical protein